MTGPAPGSAATVGAMLVVYVGALLFIGWRAARRTHGGEDFHLAGRSLGAWAAGISSTASSESGWVTLGAVGMTYAFGASGLWYAPGCLLGYLVNLYFVAPRLRRLTRDQGSWTLADVLTRRWGDPHHVVRVVAVTIILAAMMAYVAAQMTAAGKAFSAMLGIEGRAGYVTGVLVGAVVITLVTSIGGFRGVAWTDLFQGLLMAVALVALPTYAILRLGGLAALEDGLAAADPGYLTATGGRTTAAAAGFIVGQLGIGLGYPGMPHVVTRYMATRDDEQIRRLSLIAIVWGVAVFYGAGIMGLAARVLLPDLADGEQALMAAAITLLSPALAGLVLAAVLSAILSTVSSQLLVAASAVSYDLVEGVGGRTPDDRRSLLLGRWTVAFVGVLGIALALGETRVVFWFVLFAWSILGAAFGPLVLLALTRVPVGRHGALAAMLTGVGVSVVWKLGRDAGWTAGPFAQLPWSLLAAAAVLWLAARMLGRAGRGERVALAVATGISLAAWAVVRVAWLDQVYELVPAFAAALAAAVAVGRWDRGTLARGATVE